MREKHKQADSQLLSLWHEKFPTLNLHINTSEHRGTLNANLESVAS